MLAYGGTPDITLNHNVGPGAVGLELEAIKRSDSVVYNQNQFAWSNQATCEALLAASLQGVDLLLTGEKLAELDPAFTGDREPLRHCVEKLTHLSARVPVPVDIANVAFVKGSPFTSPAGNAFYPPTARSIAPYAGRVAPTSVVDPQVDIVFARTEAGPAGIAFQRENGGRMVIFNVRGSHPGTDVSIVGAAIQGSVEGWTSCNPLGKPVGRVLTSQVSRQPRAIFNARPVLYRDGNLQGSLAYLRGVRKWYRHVDAFEGLDESGRVVVASRGPLSLARITPWVDGAGALLEPALARAVQAALRSDLTLSSRLAQAPRAAIVSSDW